MKSGPLSIFLSESDNSIELFKRPSKPLGNCEWPSLLTLAGRGEAEGENFPPPNPFSGAEKRNPFKLGLGLVSGVRALLSGSPEEPGRPAAETARLGRWAGGSISVLSSLYLSLQKFLMGTYAGSRQVMNEAE